MLAVCSATRLTAMPRGQRDPVREDGADLLGTGLHFEEEWTIPATAPAEEQAQARHDGIDAAAAEFTAPHGCEVRGDAGSGPGGYRYRMMARTIDMSME